VSKAVLADVILDRVAGLLKENERRKAE
jgi:hypothetical protein